MTYRNFTLREEIIGIAILIIIGIVVIAAGVLLFTDNGKEAYGCMGLPAVQCNDSDKQDVSAEQTNLEAQGEAIHEKELEQEAHPPPGEQQAEFERLQQEEGL